MPEIKDWKKKKEAERQKLEKIKSEGGEVEEREVIEWEDADVNVSLLLSHHYSCFNIEE